jgi:hypothetical protein
MGERELGQLCVNITRLGFSGMAAEDFREMKVEEDYPFRSDDLACAQLTHFRREHRSVRMVPASPSGQRVKDGERA